MNTTFITVFGGFSDFLVAPHLASSNHLSVVVCTLQIIRFKTIFTFK